jgi:hypothetical protein
MDGRISRYANSLRHAHASLFRESGSRSGPMRSKVRLAGTVTMTVKGQFGGGYRTGCESDATAATRKLGKIAFVQTLSAVSILGARPVKDWQLVVRHEVTPSRPEMAHRHPHAAIQVAPAAAMQTLADLWLVGLSAWLQCFRAVLVSSL